MNCKPNDLAIFVRSMAGNEGRVVTCIRFATKAEVLAGDYRSDLTWWFTDGQLRSTDGSMDCLAPDEYLPHCVQTKAQTRCFGLSDCQ
jgi:hypothetical protein